ncbi:MAG TPA: hypothetical protein VLV78_11010 [Thermoanaerobaculia bacterium]|nr:hypothetical protein [Thermoanaerobaculia bacterium]
MRLSNPRARSVVVAVMLLLAGCGKESTVGLIRDVATEARPKPRVQIMIRASAEEATPQDLELLRSIEDRIERANIGRLISSGSAAGYLHLTIEVEKTADAIERLRRVLQSAGVLDRASFRVTTDREK